MATVPSLRSKGRHTQYKVRGLKRNKRNKGLKISFFAEFFLEDAIEMINFTPSPNDRKKKKSVGVETEEEEEVSVM